MAAYYSPFAARVLGTAAISLNGNPNMAAGPGAKVNLRMWSDTVSFTDVRQRLELVPHIVASKGEVRKGRKGAPLNSRFRRNYVSFEESQLNDASELQPCVANILQAVASSEYASLIRDKVVDASVDRDLQTRFRVSRRDRRERHSTSVAYRRAPVYRGSYPPRR